MSEKRFRIAGPDIRTVLEGRGGCMASDKITVGGEQVGFMYRSAPTFDSDSGWCFLSGTESDAFMDNASNFELYNVNTIANYDPDIIALVDSPVGTAFARLRVGDPLLPVPHPDDEAGLD